MPGVIDDTSLAQLRGQVEQAEADGEKFCAEIKRLRAMREAAIRMRTSLTSALESARSIQNCQECGFGQHGEYQAITAFDEAMFALEQRAP